VAGSSGPAVRVPHRRSIVRTMTAPEASNQPVDHLGGSREIVGVDELLDAARQELIRLEPTEALLAAAEGAMLVDIRPLDQRRRDGTIPVALVIDRNVLEWRLDPMSDYRDQSVDRHQRVLIICNEGYSSSLAAATLRLLGRDATDVIGGFKKWRQSGLPVVH